MNKTQKNHGQIIIIQRMFKARSKNYFENNKELLQEKAQTTIWMKLLLCKQNGIVTSFFCCAQYEKLIKKVFDENLIDKRKFKYLKNSIWTNEIYIAKTLISNKLPFVQRVLNKLFVNLSVI